MRNKLVAVLAAATGLATLIVSQGIMAQQPKPSSQAPAAKKSSAEVRYKAKQVDAVLGDEKKVRMQGDVSFTHEDTVIATDLLDYDDTTKIATSPGAIKITNPDCDINGNKGAAYFRKKLGVVEGNVVMLLKPKPADSANAGKDSIDKFKQPTTVTCERIEYFYAKKLASAQGKVVFKQTKRTGYADKAVYNQKTEVLTLTGNVRMVDEEGQTFSTDAIELSLKKGAETLKAPKETTGVFKVDESDEEDQTP